MDYDGKEFNDPILRCHECNKITHRKFISMHGGCFHCGNKRFKNVRGLDGEEMKSLKDGTLPIGVKKYVIDPDFLNLFKPAEEIDE